MNATKTNNEIAIELAAPIISFLGVLAGSAIAAYCARRHPILARTLRDNLAAPARGVRAFDRQLSTALRRISPPTSPRDISPPVSPPLPQISPQVSDV